MNTPKPNPEFTEAQFISELQELLVKGSHFNHHFLFWMLEKAKLTIIMPSLFREWEAYNEELKSK